MKTTLVTGADGFIGSHLTELLLEKGYKVRALAQYNSFNYWVGWKMFLKTKILKCNGRYPWSSFLQDLNNWYWVSFPSCSPYCHTLFLHSTRQLCRHKYHRDAKYVPGISWKWGERFLHTSTSEVYGTAPICTDRWKTSKTTAIALFGLQNWRRCHGVELLPCVWFPGYYCKAFQYIRTQAISQGNHSTIITQILEELKTIKVGDLTPTRDMNYVKDACKEF